MTKLQRLLAISIIGSPAFLQAQVTALRVGHLVDPETGTVAANQVILVESGKFVAIGGSTSIPAGAEVIDLSQFYASPGLVDAHNHLALTYKELPEHNDYYLTTVLDSTALRTVQAVSNGISILNAGFTMERDLGNNGNYADSALRIGVEQGWFRAQQSSIQESLSAALVANSFPRLNVRA